MSAQATERLQQVVGEGYRLLEPAQKYTRVGADRKLSH